MQVDKWRVRIPSKSESTQFKTADRSPFHRPPIRSDTFKCPNVDRRISWCTKTKRIGIFTSAITLRIYPHKRAFASITSSSIAPNRVNMRR